MDVKLCMIVYVPICLSCYVYTSNLKVYKANIKGHMIETSLKWMESTIRHSLVRRCLSLDFSWYDRKQVLQDHSLVKRMSILCKTSVQRC